MDPYPMETRSKIINEGKPNPMNPLYQIIFLNQVNHNEYIDNDGLVDKDEYDPYDNNENVVAYNKFPYGSSNSIPLRNFSTRSRITHLSIIKTKNQLTQAIF